MKSQDMFKPAAHATLWSVTLLVIIHPSSSSPDNTFTQELPRSPKERLDAFQATTVSLPS